MQSAFCKSTDVGKIVRQLPTDQIKHMSNVGMLVELLAKYIAKYKVHSADIDAYKYYGGAALYHDIGKVCVPNEILTKPGRLTSEEYKLIQEHPLFAQKIFEKIRYGRISGVPAHLIQFACDAAVYHHEWWNGKGYPFGISYDKIPLIARVTSVCDAYDAMTGNRTYRKAHSHVFACEELEKNSGTQFDPDIVIAFLNNESEFRDLFASKLDNKEFVEYLFAE